jgi:hypothetical protein
MAQQKGKEWQPQTKLIWAVFIFGIPIATGGGWRVASFVILGLIVASVLVGVTVALCREAGRNDHKTAPKASPEDRLLADLFGEQSHKQGSKR